MTSIPHEPAHSPTADHGTQRSMLRRVIGELVLFWGARVGLVWIGLMALLAIFAPLLASSHPLLMRTAEVELDVLTRYEAGTLVSPWLRHLSVVDVMLPVLLLAAVATWAWRGVPATRKALVLGAFAGVLVVIGLWREQLLPFVVAGHETWWQPWQEWRAGEELVAGVPAAFPIGQLIWWALRWAGLALMIGVTVALVGGVALVCGRIAPYASRIVLAGIAALVVAAVWVVALVGLGIWAWAIGGLIVLALAATALLRRRTGLELFAATLVGASMLIGGWMVHDPVSPPRLTVYEQYREAEQAGEIEWSVHTLLPYSPDDRLRDQRQMRFQSPSWDHPLGTTQSSADMAANMIHGTRIALSVGFIATSIAITIGILIGGLMGYFSGIFDLLGMRLVEMFDAIPTIFLLLAFMAAFGGGEGTLYILMIIIGLTSWVGYATFIRAEFLRLRQQEFVQAAEAVGAPLLTVLGRHLLPNGVAPLLVAASFGVAGAIGYEATLSFLGVGLDTEQSWGLLLEQALRGGAFNWWIALYPGMAIFLTVFAYILVGEALRDAIDPRTHKRTT